MGRGLSWSTTDAALVAAHVALGQTPAAIHRQRPGWSKQRIQRAVRKLRNGGTLVYQRQSMKMTAEIRDAIKNLVEENRSLSQIATMIRTTFAVSLSRSTISKYVTKHLAFKSIRKARTFNIK